MYDAQLLDMVECDLAWGTATDMCIEFTVKAQGVTKIYCIPGNAGTDSLDKVQNVSDVSLADHRTVTAFAREHGVSMVIPGSEGPLVDGIESFCRERGLQCFGPTSDAAILEGSKVFAKVR